MGPEVRRKHVLEEMLLEAWKEYPVCLGRLWGALPPNYFSFYKI